MRQPPRTDSARPAAEPSSSLIVVHGGVTYQVAVKRVARARRFTLRVRAATKDVVLTMPSRASLKTARNFAERHADWIGTRLLRMPEPIALVPGLRVPLRGIEHRVEHEAVRRSLRRVTIVPSIAIGEPPVLRVCGAIEDVGRHLVAFFRGQAQHDLTAAVARHASSLDKPCGSVAIRDTRSRWGSCSSRGKLNFSWRLVLAPSFVLDYLAAHECAHLCHMNHSAAFWEVASRLAPRMAEAEAWLKEHGSTLHLYRA